MHETKTFTLVRHLGTLTLYWQNIHAVRIRLKPEYNSGAQTPLPLQTSPLHPTSSNFSPIGAKHMRVINVLNNTAGGDVHGGAINRLLRVTTNLSDSSGPAEAA